MNYNQLYNIVTDEPRSALVADVRYPISYEAQKAIDERLKHSLFTKLRGLNSVWGPREWRLHVKNAIEIELGVYD